MNGYSISREYSPSPQAALQTGVPQLTTLDSFRLDSSELTGDHKKILDDMAKRIAYTHQTPQPVLEIVVVGFADKSGSWTYNHYLGLKRACSAASQLLYVLHRKYGKQLIFPVPVTLNTEGELSSYSEKNPKERRVEIWLRAEPPRRNYPKPYTASKRQGETMLDEILSFG
ncbi:MAG: hypothetical protein DYG98_18670 [Haliscomenobacteraceae bacterium CHB4]|nr:hypothetical protein [Saprospiraceae bacterium]MCE7925082.1 hypothetical protein [Haliscomenobacteraceae bacterium CHB4]